MTLWTQEKASRARVAVQPYENRLFGSKSRKYIQPCMYVRQSKGKKGVRRMPRLSQAMKDVTSCDKPRQGANDR